MANRSYEQYCPVAGALDVLGERWTLLILRELFFGPQRFTDLRHALPGIAREAVAIKAKALWCQFTVINEEGARIAEEGGLTVIMDRCLKVEHARYVGRMHWLGFNTQRITSVRGGLQ